MEAWDDRFKALEQRIVSLEGRLSEVEDVATRPASAQAQAPVVEEVDAQFGRATKALIGALERLQKEQDLGPRAELNGKYLKDQMLSYDQGVKFAGGPHGWKKWSKAWSILELLEPVDSDDLTMKAQYRFGARFLTRDYPSFALE